MAALFRSADLQMRYTFAAIFAFFVVGVYLFLRPSKFHTEFPAIHPRLQLINDSGRPIQHGAVKVITSYWYPSLFGRPKGRSFTDVYPIDSDGRCLIALKVHHQITKQEIIIESDSREVFSTRVDDDLDWKQFEESPRTIHIIDTSQNLLKNRIFRGANAFELRKFRLQPRGDRIEYDLTEGVFKDSGGDLVFILDRPRAEDDEKFVKPVSVEVFGRSGRVQRMSNWEISFGLEGAVARWGDSESIKLSAQHSRKWPAVVCSFGYSSADGRRRALVKMNAHPVGEQIGEDAYVEVSIYAKVSEMID